MHTVKWPEQHLGGLWAPDPRCWEWERALVCPQPLGASPALAVRANVFSLRSRLGFPVGLGGPSPASPHGSEHQVPWGDQIGTAKEVACCLFSAISPLVLVLLGGSH